MPPELQVASLHPEVVALDANRDARLLPVYWCYQEAGRVMLHSFHLETTLDLEVTDIQSAYGYGGPISNSDAPDFLEQADHAFCQWAREHSVIAEFLRFHPLVAHGQWYSGKVVHNRETVYINLLEDLFQQYAVRRRTDVRRMLEAALTIERVDARTMGEVFPEIYRNNMEQIGAGRSYYFPVGYFDALFLFLGTENWLAYHEGKAVAGAVFLVSEQAKMVEYHLGAKLQGFEQLRAPIGLLHHAAAFYQSLGYRRLYLGGGRSTEVNDSLLFFKRGFSPYTAPFRFGSRIYDPEQYARLQQSLPDKAANGRVLFYKD
jgi:hypothetical protein